MNKDELDEDLALLVRAGLVDIKMREDGQWLYSASQYSKTLTEEQIHNILINLEELHQND